MRESGAILGGCRGAREKCALGWRRGCDGPSSRTRVLVRRLASSRALLRRGPSILSRTSSPSPSGSLRWLMVYPEKMGQPRCRCRPRSGLWSPGRLHRGRPGGITGTA